MHAHVFRCLRRLTDACTFEHLSRRFRDTHLYRVSVVLTISSGFWFPGFTPVSHTEGSGRLMLGVTCDSFLSGLHHGPGTVALRSLFGCG